MEKRRIDLSRCLVRDGKADCHRCEEICPQKAIQDHVVDTAACDGGGLCSAICPAAAIVAPEDYEGALTKAQELAPQVLMCEKASEGGVHCLGFLTRRLLWALAAKRPLALDISHCEACRPAVFAHLEREVAAAAEVQGLARLHFGEVFHLVLLSAKKRCPPYTMTKNWLAWKSHVTRDGM